MARFCDYCSTCLDTPDKPPHRRRRFCGDVCRVRFHRNHEKLENLARILESLMLAGILMPERRGDFERAAILAQQRLKRMRGM